MPGFSFTAPGPADGLSSLASRQNGPPRRHPLDRLGRALGAQRRWAEAREAYQNAQDIWEGLGETITPIGSLAGLASAALQLEELPAALAYVEEILPNFNGEIANQNDEPGWVFWVCYQVLQAAGDQRALEVLKDANQWLVEGAKRIKDPEMRRAFLENIEYNACLRRAMP